MSNANCFTGLRCPACKSGGPFEIFTALFTVHDDEDYADAEGSNGSFCFCPRCDHEEYVFGFTLPG